MQAQTAVLRRPSQLCLVAMFDRPFDAAQFFGSCHWRIEQRTATRIIGAALCGERRDDGPAVVAVVHMPSASTPFFRGEGSYHARASRPCSRPTPAVAT